MTMKNYNILFLRGYRHISDERYCEVKGLDPSLAGTPEINNDFIKESKENEELVKRKLAEAGLLHGENDDNKEL